MQAALQQQAALLFVPSKPTAWPIQRASRAPCRLQQMHRTTLSGSAAADGAAGSLDGDGSGADSSSLGAQPLDRRQLWKAAIKLPMYSVGVVPVLVGVAAAYYEGGVVPWGRVAGLLGGAVCVIAWLNLSNDAFDATTGVDATKHESVVNLTGNRGAVLAASAAFLAAGVGLLAAAALAGGAHDGCVAAMLGAAIACGYVYQGPPFRLSYKGLGEPLCFVAFGPLATSAFFLACSGSGLQSLSASTAAAAGVGAGASGAAAVSPLVWLLGVVVGITTSVILFCSHWHQIQGDVAAGKLSPLVRLGTARACKVLVAATASPYVLALAGAAAGVLPLPLLAVLAASVPAAKALTEYAHANHRVPAQIAPLKRFGVRWHAAVGACLAAGLVACRVL